MCHCQKQDQEDPCKIKSRVVSDATYCDRYWECVDGQPELYDCPNGLVFAGKNRGVTEGCDYPWRASYCVGKQTASKITKLLSFNFIFLNAKSYHQMVPYLTSTVTGYTESLDMKHRARVIGLVGTVPLLSNCALEDCYTTKLLTAVIGRRFVDLLVFVEDSLNF